MAKSRTPNSGMRSLFPVFYTPHPGEERDIVTGAMVVLDTNALLDLYRYTDSTREEFLDALDQLGDRLFIPNRTGQEFFENRLRVMRDRRDERSGFDAALRAALTKPAAEIVAYATRRGLPAETVATLTGILAESADDVLAALDDVDDPNAVPDPDAHPDSDPILQRVEKLTDGRVGAAFEVADLARLQAEGQRRLTAQIPPGFGDKSKGDRSIGDFLIWEQTLREAERRKVPVLMICNETKTDWVRFDGAQLNPHPELVKEMLDRTGQRFHLVDVRTFLTLAREHLAATIRDATVAEAGRLAITAELTAEARVDRAMPVKANGIQEFSLPRTILIDQIRATQEFINGITANPKWADAMYQNLDLGNTFSAITVSLAHNETLGKIGQSFIDETAKAAWSALHPDTGKRIVLDGSDSRPHVERKVDEDPADDEVDDTRP